MKRRTLIWCGIGYALLRWILMVQPGYVYDVSAYKRWSLEAARFGIPRVYETSDMDYPPLYAYILAPLGHLYGALSPEALARMQDSTLLTVLIKLPPLLFDLAIAWLLLRWATLGAASRVAGGGERSWRWILPAAYLLNPAVLFNGAYWGEPDSIHSFFILAAFLTVGHGAAFWRRAVPSPAPGGVASLHAQEGAAPLPAPGSAVLAWVFLALATLMKPLGAPFFPLLLVLSLALYGARATAAGIGAAAAVTALVFLPFVAAGRGAAVFHRVLGDVNAMPYTSSNAHNLWWLLGSWRNAEVPWLGPLTATQFSMILFAAAYAALLWKAHRLHHGQGGGLRPVQAIGLAALLAFSFFMLSTHMHENHLFAMIPLLAVLLPEGRHWRRLFAAVSLAVLCNLILHDLIIPNHWPWTLGGSTQVQNLDFKRPFFAGELAGIWISTLFNLALYALTLFWIFRPGGHGWLERAGSGGRPVILRTGSSQAHKVSSADGP